MCATAITEALLHQNGGLGARLTSFAAPAYLVDRVRVTGNSGGGIRAEGAGTLRSSIIANNMMTGLELVGLQAGRPDVSFLTIIGGLNCSALSFGPSIPVANILVQQGVVQNPLIGITDRVCNMSKCLALFGFTESGCTRAEDVSLTADFHLPVGQINSAIDTAGGGAGTLDIDGEARPKGAAPDIGADEAF